MKKCKNCGKHIVDKDVLKMMFLQECKVPRLANVKAMLEYFEIDEKLKSEGLAIARKDAIFDRDFDKLKDEESSISYQEIIEMIFRNAGLENNTNLVIKMLDNFEIDDVLVTEMTVTLMFLQECNAHRLANIRAMLEYFEIDEPLKSKGLEIARKDAIFNRDFDKLKDNSSTLSYEELVDMILRNASLGNNTTLVGLMIQNLEIDDALKTKYTAAMMFLQECNAGNISTVRGLLQNFEIDESLKSKGLEIARKNAIFNRDFDRFKDKEYPLSYQQLLENIVLNASRKKNLILVANMMGQFKFNDNLKFKIGEIVTEKR